MNTEQVARELRRLTDERDHGRMPFADYRQRRAELLDGLVGLATAKDLDATRPRQAKAKVEPPVVAPVPVPAKAAAPLPSAAAAPVSSTRATGRSMGLLIGAGFAVVALAGGVWLWLGHSRPVGGVADSATAVEGPSSGASVGPSPVDVFLQRADWSDGALSALNSAWWSMSDREILATLTSEGSRRLADEVAARLRTRGTHGGPPPLDPDAPLLLLARNLNVPVPSSAIGPRSATATLAVEPSAPAAAKPAPSKDVQAVPAVPARATGAAQGQGRAPAVTAVAPAVVPAVSPADASRSATTAADPCASAKRRRCHDDLAAGRPGPDLIVVPPGRIRMGSTLAAEEQPVHEVALLRPLAMTRSEVTVGQWRTFCEATGRAVGAAAGDEMPVVNVSWKDATDYAKWLSEQTGRHYRLPSEVEWEYAARADTAGEPGHELPALNPNTDARYAAPGGQQPTGPTTVDDPTFRPNGFGLVHVLGNVREWVQDPWSADYQHATADAAPREGGGTTRVVRGGSFRDGPERVRPAARDHLEATVKDAQTGFRLVRDIRSL